MPGSPAQAAQDCVRSLGRSPRARRQASSIEGQDPPLDARPDPRSHGSYQVNSAVRMAKLRLPRHPAEMHHFSPARALPAGAALGYNLATPVPCLGGSMRSTIVAVILGFV